MFFGRKPTSETDLPFQAVVRPTPNEPPPVDESPVSHDPSEEGWSVDEIEAAYLRALEAAEAVEAPEFVPAESVEAAAADDGPNELPHPSADGETSPAVAAPEPLAVATATPVADAPRVTPRQIIEALLFVGGRPLTSRQLADVLSGSTTPEQVDDLIVGLNAEYSRQQRPYEVRLGEGGYRLDLHSEFDKVRARVFGIGPREVKLAQNALEVLALVAYQQPLSKAEVEDSGIHGAAGLLRQLLRRELITLQRGTEGGPDTYRTTARFLELFGLRSLADLPRPEAVNLR